MIRRYIKNILQWLHFDVTKNMRYDRYTTRVMQATLSRTSNCVDIGAHQGELLKEILRIAPQGQHFAFEPLPHLYKKLQETYGDRVQLHADALSDCSGEDVFHHVVDAPAYSGLKKRDYDHRDPDIMQIPVSKNTLDALIKSTTKIDFIKIDVEGAEMEVLRGAKNLIARDQPLIIFEFGKGASDHYQATPEDLYNLLCADLKMALYTLRGWLDQKKSISLEQITKYYESGQEYYFLATKQESRL
ncbi:MAG: FkbM family methyltransferase [Saprospiraceae bacterium]|nr:FkbM family methyltransferase [Saprospiraceae bacterium]